MNIDQVSTPVLFVLLAAAVLIDFRQRRIPNSLVLTGLLAAAGLYIASLLTGVAPTKSGSPWSLMTGLIAGGAALLPLYLLRACGAGDVKLMAMVGAFTGAPVVLMAALYTLVAGALLALVYMTVRGVARQTLANTRFLLTDWVQRAQSGQLGGIAPLRDTRLRLPYGVAIAMGTAAALHLRA